MDERISDDPVVPFFVGSESFCQDHRYYAVTESNLPVISKVQNADVSIEECRAKKRVEHDPSIFAFNQHSYEDKIPCSPVIIISIVVGGKSGYNLHATKELHRTYARSEYKQGIAVVLV